MPTSGIRARSPQRCPNLNHWCRVGIRLPLCASWTCCHNESTVLPKEAEASMRARLGILPFSAHSASDPRTCSYRAFRSRAPCARRCVAALSEESVPANAPLGRGALEAGVSERRPGGLMDLLAAARGEPGGGGGSKSAGRPGTVSRAAESRLAGPIKAQPI